MPDFDITRDDLEETGVAVAIFIGGVVAAWIVALLMRRIIHVATRATQTDLDDEIAEEVRSPVVALVVVQSAYIALRWLSYLDEHRDTMRSLWAATTLLVVIFLIWRVITATFAWYARAEARRGSIFSLKTLPIVQRIVNITVLLVGGVLVLDQLGIAISPLLAGLGIGGLAVALAIQPILANMFAGSYILSDGSIRVGDFIELDGGPTGWVDDIGLRATRVRTFDNNLIIIPNSTLADATVTNFDTGDPPVGAPVICGVAYEEDLERVEAVVVDELRRIVEQHPEADKDYSPVVRFRLFGDSNIDFLMKLQARNRRDVGLLSHEMIKRVHARFTAEGITINYPARRLFLEPGDTGGLERLAPAGSADGRGATRSEP